MGGMRVAVFSPMTRITPISGAMLAHSAPQQQRFRSSGRAQSAEAASERRHFGNRRMGDRRVEDRRAGGRRATDQMTRPGMGPWISADFSAHLIGQAEPVAVNTRSAQKAYANTPVRNGYRKGGLV